MTHKEAREILLSKINKGKIIKCYEYDSVFVFQIVPEDVSIFVDTGRVLDSTMSVDKRTGAVKSFKPFHIPISEYKAGKEVSIE